MVVVPDDQLSLAIGREGQNARLAAKLTGWRIDIKSLTEAATDAFRKLREMPDFDEVAVAQPEIAVNGEVILAKKAEGKPITPEEYQVLTKLVELVEKRVAKTRQQDRAAKVEKVALIKATIPAPAYTVMLADAKLPDRVLRTLAEADFQSVGQIMEQLALNEDRILGLPGFGPKMLEDLKAALATVVIPEPPVVETPVVEPEALAAEAAPAAELAVGTAEPVAATDGAAAPEAVLDQALAADGAVPATEGVLAEPVEGEAVAEGAEIGVVEEDGDEDKDSDDPDDKKKGKKKGKKKAAVEITFDEDLGMFITRKKRKPGRAKDEMFGLLDDE
jgi:N utilization substance protein A